MSSVIVCAISRATLWKKKISRAARIERAKGRPRSSLSLRARSSRGEGSLMVTTSSSSVGVLDIELPRIRLYVLLARNSDTSNSPESQAPDRAEDVTKAVLARIVRLDELYLALAHGRAATHAPSHGLRRTRLTSLRGRSSTWGGVAWRSDDFRRTPSSSCSPEDARVRRR